MITKFPQIVVSRDGRRAIAIESLATDLTSPSGFDGFPLDTIVRLRPRGGRRFIQVKVSGTFSFAWDTPRQTLKWDEAFDGALPDLALIAIGVFLDENEIPDEPPEDVDALHVQVNSYLFDIFKQKPADDAELREYVRGRIYWTRKFKAEPTVFEAWEARRLNVDVSDLHDAAFPNVGILWQHDESGAYRAMPALVTQYDMARAPSPSPVGAVAPPMYDVALSFAGEQRPFVEAVAIALGKGGATVFYDAHVDLWGKDLTTELEYVYRTGSRFVVVFVSHEYVGKAWTNLERQHALSGRMERKDDSVLPARFDPIELPGLPITVGYLDIGQRSPEDIADLVLEKLKR